MSSNAERIEIYSGIQRRRRYSVDEKLRILQEASRPGTRRRRWQCRRDRPVDLRPRHHSSEFRQRMREINQCIKPCSKELLAQRLCPLTRRAQMPHHSAPVLTENCPKIINFWQSKHVPFNQKRLENKGEMNCSGATIYDSNVRSKWALLHSTIYERSS